ncbi:MAG: hypothetical protein ABIO70_10840 [Pseudomonadota bacterium]
MTSAIFWIALLSAADARVNRSVEDGLTPAQLQVQGDARPLDPDPVDDPGFDSAAELQASLFGEWSMAKV